jgi:alanyl-tRNA synthetase
MDPVSANLAETVVTFPTGGLSATGTVGWVGPTRSGLAVVTDVTPFHPVDPGWPDQGPDLGTLSLGGVTVPVIDVVLGATDGNQVFVGDDVPVRRGTVGWNFLVVHILGPGAQVSGRGGEVHLAVDPDHRAALSAGHTACHLAALALNGALADRWRKDTATDGLGAPDFDGRAITSSRIVPDGAVDRYRLGKSLRKSGFDSEGLGDALPDVVAAVNAELAGWVGTGAAVRVEAAGPRVTDRREWVCDLPDGQPRIRCGGTHVSSLAEFDAVAVALDLDEANQSLVMQTSVTRR